MVFRQRFVLDTTALTNATEKTTTRVVLKHVKELVELVAQARIKLSISCYIPYPSVYEEMMQGLRMRKASDELVTGIDTWFVKKTPDRYEIRIPADIFYEYITDIRERINKGLRVAEEAVIESSKKKHHAPIITMLREKYKQELRKGILDSKEDLDVLLLAKEMEAGVVSADKGIEKWAERLGLQYVEAKQFSGMLREYLVKGAGRRAKT